MGFENRDYMRSDRGGTAWSGFSGAGHSAVRTILLITIVVWLVQLMTGPAFFWRFQLWPLDSGRFAPWQPLTYGFLHSIQDPLHLIFNMMGLWFFGRMVEDALGSREFAAVYLLGILAGAAGHLVESALHPTGGALGASAAVMTVTGWCAVKYPREKLLFMMIIPMELRVAAVLFIVMDALGVGTNIAHGAHLGGIAFGLAAAWFDWRFTGWELTRRWARQAVRRATGPGRRLKVYSPTDVDEEQASLPERPAPKPSEDFGERVDQLLQKISKEGQDSLTEEERRILIAAADVYKKRQQPGSK